MTADGGAELRPWPVEAYLALSRSASRRRHYQLEPPRRTVWDRIRERRPAPRSA